MRTRILGSSIAAAGLLATGLPAASAATPTLTPTASGSTAAGSTPTASGPTPAWTPVTYSPRDYPAGDVCTFELKVDFPTQAVEDRVSITNPDGTPFQTDFRGPLTARFTNAATGAQYLGDLSGAATLWNLPTGWSLWNVPDNIGVTIHAGNPYHAQGEFILSGGSVIAVSPTHQDAILHQTTVTDVCAELS
ncbi:hypothetical protein [Catenulispora yoronensis]